MNRTRWFCASTLALALWIFGPPADLQAQRSGGEIWRATCGNCHALQPPGRYTAKDWRSIGTHMIITARLTTAQGEAVMEFLQQGARQAGRETSDAADLARTDGTSDSGVEPELEPIRWAPGVGPGVEAYVRELRTTSPRAPDDPAGDD